MIKETIFLFLTSITTFWSTSLEAQFFDELFTITEKTRPYFSFIADHDHVNDKEKMRYEVVKELGANGILLNEGEKRIVRIGVDSALISNMFKSFYYSDNLAHTEINFIECSINCDLYELFEDISKKISWYTGSWSKGEIQAIKIKVSGNTNHFVLLYTGTEIIVINYNLGFPIPESPADLSQDKQQTI